MKLQRKQLSFSRPIVVDNDQYLITKAKSHKMSLEFNCDQKTIINHLHNQNYTNKVSRCTTFFKQK